MKDLISHKNRANIIPITKKLKTDTPTVVTALNQVISHLEFPTSQKSEEISKLIYVLQLLDAKNDDLVLQVGADKERSALVLAEMGAKVILLTDDKFGSLKRLAMIQKDCVNRIQVVSKEQLSVIANHAPFDRILVSPEVSNIPPDLYALLAVDGNLVLSKEEAGNATFFQITRTSDDQYDLKRKNGLKDKTASYEVFDL